MIMIYNGKIGHTRREQNHMYRTGSWVAYRDDDGCCANGMGGGGSMEMGG